VALEGDVWVGLVGFGSAALSLAARESYVGWSEQVKNRRLRYVLLLRRICAVRGNVGGGGKAQAAVLW
ncbi:MAG: DUF4338 domain-containing protein, partial [Actinomycetota bacterium]|nr:DUF4338 domain-containing protein [Actinomycetota bacterium]